MNREIKSKKVKGKGRIYLEVCPVKESTHLSVMVGSPHCLQCENFVKVVNHRDGRRSVHCKVAK